MHYCLILNCPIFGEAYKNKSSIAETGGKVYIPNETLIEKKPIDSNNTAHKKKKIKTSEPVITQDVTPVILQDGTPVIFPHEPKVKLEPVDNNNTAMPQDKNGSQKINDHIAKKKIRTPKQASASSEPEFNASSETTVEKKQNTAMIDGLVKGKLAYKVPDTMKVNNLYDAMVSIAKSVDNKVLLEGIKDTAGFKIEGIKISSRLRVSLVDPGKDNFIINPLNNEEQRIDSVDNTVWRWNIKPVKSGNHNLYLKATALILDSKLGNTYKDVPVLDKVIMVRSEPFLNTVLDFWKTYWQWLMGTFIIPIYFWVRNKPWKKKELDNKII